jgi:dATP pyrophosphohydrolase
MPRAPFQVLVIPYRVRAGLEVAVFRRADHDVWQFVSGGGELGESVEDAARREGFEEAGIPLQSRYLALDATITIPACWFEAWPSWPEEVLLVPEHSFAVAVEGELEIGREHLEMAWLNLHDAMDRLRFDSNKNALWELNERLYPSIRRKRPAYALSP